MILDHPLGHGSNARRFDPPGRGTLGGVVVFLLWLWITNMAGLLGVEFNAETERTRELHEGVRGADDELKLPERDRPSAKQRAQTA